MVAILHKQLKLPDTLHRTMQILSVHPFEKTPITQLLTDTYTRTYDHGAQTWQGITIR